MDMILSEDIKKGDNIVAKVVEEKVIFENK